jgi:hypothetical protein
LPTLEPGDLSPSALTDARRYRALSAAIRRVRGVPFHVRIEGENPLVLDVDDVTLEGATTSFQAHLRVAPADFARTYNAAQIATAPALAIGANSPTFLGHRLWDETRIALFRQSVDDRVEATSDWRPSRVSFGHGWVREGIAELFEECVAMHAPLLPLDDGEDALGVVRAARVPRLAALRLHSGTTWRWNRPVYDEAHGGHLRIEMRALPAGPTTTDALATAAFLLGLTLGLAPHTDAIVRRLTFGQARRNFYEAAQHGPDAEILWPSEAVPSPRAVRALDLVRVLIPVARHGLLAHGVAEEEADAMLDVISARVARGTTGARWQRGALAVMPRAEMLERYLAHAATGEPVHAWPAVLP